VVCGRIVPGGELRQPIVESGESPPFEALASRLRGIPTWIFHGDADQVVPVDESRRLVAALQKIRAPIRYSELTGVDHNAWDEAFGSAEVPRWLLAQRRTTQSDTGERQR
jgi:predicted peptidase